MTAGHADMDAAHADLDPCADLEQFQAQAFAGGLGQFGASQPDAAQRLDRKSTRLNSSH